MNSMTMFINVIASPAEAFRALKDKPHFWLPLVLVPLAVAVYQIIYFQMVDYNWMLDQMALQAELKGGDPAQIEGIQNIPKNLMMIPGVIAGIVMLLIVQVIYASYLLVVGKVSGVQLGFKSAFSLALWAGIPVIFTFAASIVNVFLADAGKIYIDATNPFSLNSLLFDVSYENALRGVLTSIDLFTFWTFSLLTIAYKQFSGRSTLHSALVALAPYLVVYVIWILVSAL